MSLVNEDTYLVQIIQQIVVVLALVHTVCLLGYHTYTIWRKTKNQSVLPVEYISIFSLCTMLLFSLATLMWNFPFYSLDHCSLINAMSVLFYVWSKLSLHIFFLERLFVICCDDKPQTISFKFTTRQIMITRLSVFVWSIFIAFVFIFTYKPRTSSHRSSCTCFIHPFAMASLAVGDLLISLSISVVLCRRLLLLAMIAPNKACSDAGAEEMNGRSNSDSGSKSLLLNRLIVLSVAAVLVTQLSYALSAVFTMGTIWSLLDTVVHSWCVILTFNTHSPVFCGRVCGLLQRLVTAKCLSLYSCDCCCKITSNATMKTTSNATSSSDRPLPVLELHRSITMLDASNSVPNLAIQ
eukprot:132830_1